MPSACFLFLPSASSLGRGGGGGALVVGKALGGGQSGARPNRWSPTAPSGLHRVPVSCLPLHGVSPEGVAVLSEPLDVPVFLAEDGNLVLEQNRIQSHLGMDERHAAKPAGELVHAGLPLGKVVRIGPPGRPRRLEGGLDTKKKWIEKPNNRTLETNSSEENRGKYCFTVFL